SYQAIVIPGIPLCNFNCNSLTNLSYFSQGSESDSYVTAEFSDKSVPENRLTFVLGDRLYYGGFYNAPLKPRKAYCVVLRTVSKYSIPSAAFDYRYFKLSCCYQYHLFIITLPSMQHIPLQLNRQENVFLRGCIFINCYQYCPRKQCMVLQRLFCLIDKTPVHLEEN
ncbi:hypothetical protein E2320_017224, partial [Naja naja]